MIAIALQGVWLQLPEVSSVTAHSWFGPVGWWMRSWSCGATESTSVKRNAARNPAATIARTAIDPPWLSRSFIERESASSWRASQARSRCSRFALRSESCSMFGTFSISSSRRPPAFASLRRGKQGGRSRWPSMRDELVNQPRGAAAQDDWNDIPLELEHSEEGDQADRQRKPIDCLSFGK
jgi:hypothetical protein